MQLWFLAVLGAAVVGGVGNFIIKIAAKQGYDGGLFSLYAGLIPTVLVLFITMAFSDYSAFSIVALIFAFLSGFLGGVSNILKVLALRYIDAAIYFPLFKILSPILVTVGGIIFFSERLSGLEWLGLFLGVVVPLLLINKNEQSRQVNLKSGFILVVVTALIGALGAVLTKYAAVVWPDPWWLLVGMGVGVICGSWLGVVLKEKKRVLTLTYWKISMSFILWSTLWGILMSIAALLVFVAYANAGIMIIVYAVNSLNIIIPIILAVIIYKEHMNVKKAIAIGLSIAAVGLLG